MSQRQHKKVRRFTGYHATAIIVAFFAVVVAVNLTMARFAISTFGGTVVDNSYVASQKFNGWLEEARREKEMGWRIAQPVRYGPNLSIIATDALGKPLSGATISAIAHHPLGREPEQRLTFAETAPGTYHSLEGLPAGRWKLKAQIERDGRELDLAFEVE